MRIFRRGLTLTEWGTLAGLLVRAEYSVTPAKHKETERGRPVPCIEIQDTKKTAPDAANIEGGKDDGITYSGLPVVENLTCAVDPDCIPLYSDVFVEYADGSVEQLWATDTGVKGNHIDIYTPDYDHAIQCGRQSLTVWWVGPEEVET